MFIFIVIIVLKFLWIFFVGKLWPYKDGSCAFDSTRISYSLLYTKIFHQDSMHSNKSTHHSSLV